jgi:uncharacterized protein YndB with AHSA1/START domain
MTTQTVEQELLELEHEYWRAIRDKDATTAMRLTDERCFVTGAQGLAEIARNAIGNMIETARYTLRVFDLSDVHVRLLRDDVAVVVYRVREDLTVDGAAVTVEAANASTWIRRNGGWVCSLHTEALKGDPYGRDKSPEQSAVNYVIHVAATPEQLWDALTSAEALRHTWGHIESTWRPGAPVSEVDDSGKILWKGEVIRADAPRALSFTFDVAGDGEPPTQVTFELERPVSRVSGNSPAVRLVLTQTGFPRDSKLSADCARAWTEILSSMKSYVETGKAIPFDWKH